MIEERDNTGQIMLNPDTAPPPQIEIGNIGFVDNVNTGQEWGRLYNWPEAMDPKVSPPGWHIPSIAEWDKLWKLMSKAAGYGDSCTNTTRVAQAFSNTTMWDPINPSLQGTDLLGFDGKPIGRYAFGGYEYRGRIYAMWTTESYKYLEISTYACYSPGYIYYYTYDIKCCIRCCRPASDLNGDSGVWVDPRDYKRYRWKKIGDLIWMVDHLDYAGTNYGAIYA